MVAPPPAFLFKKLKKKEKKEKTLYIKKQGWEPIHKKCKANKSTKTQPSIEHNNQGTTNTQDRRL
jgi:hypothetical protein